MKKFIFALFLLVTVCLVACTKPSLSFKDSTVEVFIGEEFELQPELKDGSGAIDYSFTGDLIKYENGVFTALKEGSVVVTAFLKDNTGVKATVTVVVKKVLVESISISGSTSVYIGKTTTLSATVAPANATDKTLEWTSSNPSVATVANGVVTGVGEGDCVITVKAKDGSNVTKTHNIKSSVAPAVDPTDFVLVLNGDEIPSGGTITLTEFDVVQFTIKYLPVGENLKEGVDYSLPANLFCNITVDGQLTCQAPGTVDLTVYGVYAPTDHTYTIVIEEKYFAPEELSVDFQTSNLFVGDKVNFKTVVSPERANQKVVYSIDKPEVATISETGELVAVSTGSAVVTVKSEELETLLETYTINVIATPAASNNVYFSESLAHAEINSKVTYETVEYTVGVNAFGTFSQAIAVATKKVIFGAGDYLYPINVTKAIELVGPNAGVLGYEARKDEAVIKANLTVSSNNVTIDGLGFSGLGRFTNSGLISNLIFKNNKAFDIYYNSDLGFFYLGASEGGFNENIEFINNGLYNLDGKTASIRPIFVMNAKNLTVDNNVFDTYKRDLLFTGTNGYGLAGDTNTDPTGSGLAGDFVFTNNVIKNAGYRGIHITRHVTDSMTIHNNVFDDVVNAAICIYGFDYDSGASTDISIKFNEINKALNGIYVDPEKAVGTDYSDFKVTIEYNYLHDFRTNGKPTLYHFYSYITDPSMAFATPKFNFFGEGYSLDELVVDKGYVVVASFTTLEDYEKEVLLDNLPYDVYVDKDNLTNPNTYATIAEALTKVHLFGTIHLAAGTYTESFTISRPVTILGPNANKTGYFEDRDEEAVMEGVLTVKSNYVTIKGLAFTKTSRVINSGVVKNLSFVNNYAYDIVYGSELAFFYLSSSALENTHENILFEGNYLNSVTGHDKVRPIFVMNVKNFTVNNNVIDTYSCNILVTGTNGLDTEGGLMGEFVFTNNTIKYSGYRGLHVTSYSASKLVIENNVISNVVNAAITIYGYKIVEGNTTSVSIKYNIITKVLNGIYLDPDDQTDFTKFKVDVSYNALYDFNNPDGLPTIYHFYSGSNTLSDYFVAKYCYFGEDFDTSKMKYYSGTGITVSNTIAKLDDFLDAIRNLTYPLEVYVDKDNLSNPDTYATIQDALENVNVGGTVYVVSGTYEENITIARSVTIVGPNAGKLGNSSNRTEEALIKGTITVSGNNVTIKGLAFTGTSRVINSGVVKNLSFVNNYAYDIVYSTDLAFFYLSSSSLEITHEDILFEGNYLNKIGGTTNVRPIFVMNVKNFTVNNNVIDTYSRDNLVTGTNGLAAEGGLMGEFVFTNNTIKNAGFRGLHITSYSATKMVIEGNVIDSIANAAFSIYGYKIVGDNTTEISIKYNIVTKALNGIYLDPDDQTDFTKFKVDVSYNAFYDFNSTDGLPTLYHFYSGSSTLSNYFVAKNCYFGENFDVNNMKYYGGTGITVSDIIAKLEDFLNALDE